MMLNDYRCMFLARRLIRFANLAADAWISRRGELKDAILNMSLVT